jgi:hypothetical protein
LSFLSLTLLAQALRGSVQAAAKKHVTGGGFQDGDYWEEAESMLPKVNSWRDAGNTPGRKNHQEEAKL